MCRGWCSSARRQATRCDGRPRRECKRRMRCQRYALRAPGISGDAQDAERPRCARDDPELGFPLLLVKAVAGGGGQRQRACAHEAERSRRSAGTPQQAQHAAASDALMLGRLIRALGRHIQGSRSSPIVQGPRHPHLGERDCGALAAAASERRSRSRPRQWWSRRRCPMGPYAGHDATGRSTVGGLRSGAGAGAEFISSSQSGRHLLPRDEYRGCRWSVRSPVRRRSSTWWSGGCLAARRAATPCAQDQVAMRGRAIRDGSNTAEDPTGLRAPQTSAVLHWRPGGAATADPAASRSRHHRRQRAVGPCYWC